jgi:hypothetical protein
VSISSKSIKILTFFALLGVFCFVAPQSSDACARHVYNTSQCTWYVYTNMGCNAAGEADDPSANCAHDMENTKLQLVPSAGGMAGYMLPPGSSMGIDLDWTDNGGGVILLRTRELNATPLNSSAPFEMASACSRAGSCSDDTLKKVVMLDSTLREWGLKYLDVWEDGMEKFFWPTLAYDLVNGECHLEHTAESRSLNVQFNSTPNHGDVDGDIHISGCPLVQPSGARIALQAVNGQYLVAEGGGGREFYANRDGIGPWETLTVVRLGGNKVALASWTGHYVVADNGGGGALNANRTEVGPWETFTLVDLGGGQVALQAVNGQYVVAEGGGGGGVYANRDAIGPWETFTLIELDPN